MDIDINNFAAELLIIASVIITIGGAIAVIKKWIKESKPSKHEEVLKKHDEEISKLKEKVAVLESTKRNQDKFVEAICSSMLALLDHNINGNSIDKLKEAKEEMQEFLIHRG